MGSKRMLAERRSPPEPNSFGRPASGSVDSEPECGSSEAPTRRSLSDAYRLGEPFESRRSELQSRRGTAEEAGSGRREAAISQGRRTRQRQSIAEGRGQRQARQGKRPALEPKARSGSSLSSEPPGLVTSPSVSPTRGLSEDGSSESEDAEAELCWPYRPPEAFVSAVGREATRDLTIPRVDDTVPSSQSCAGTLEESVGVCEPEEVVESRSCLDEVSADWKAACAAAVHQGFDGLSTAEHLHHIVVSLPHALGKSLQLLCERDPLLDVHDLSRPMPPCGRKGNRRDLLPLMLSARPPCELAESESARSAEGVATRETWVRVMVCVLNWQYCGESMESTLARHGPVSGLQRDALDRLYGLAHSFV